MNRTMARAIQAALAVVLSLATAIAAAQTPVDDEDAILLLIKSKSQTITFAALGNKVYGAAPFSVSATASSGLLVSFVSTTPSVCTVTVLGTTVTILNAGTCTIEASQAGNALYRAAPKVDRSFTVTQASQTITFAALSNKSTTDPQFSVSASASSSLLVSFVSTTPGVCTVTVLGTAVTIVSAGTCTIEASQAGNADYAPAANVDQSFNVIQVGPDSYIYDSLGRLIGVVQGSGDAARYVYDAVGNTTRVDRAAAGTVALLGFDPASGTMGTVVTLYGIGFSSTPVLNNVSFNGVAATVVTANVNKLTVAVPAGATTGLISVTAPLGSATSASSFTIQTPPAPPVVSGFSPGSGAAGTGVTISGSNFVTTTGSTGGNEVKFNGGIAPVTSATSTSVVVTVPPAATTGRVSVRTSAGVGTSVASFVVPPPGHAAGDTQTQTSIVIDGASVPLTITGGTSNAVDVLTFDGVAGQNLGLGIDSVSYSGGAAGLVTVIRPDGGTLATSGTLVGGAVVTLSNLPISGTYSIVFARVGSGTANANFTLSSPLVGSAVLNVNGPTITSSRTGQSARYTFTGTVGATYSVALTGIATSLADFVTVYQPGGGILVARTMLSSPGNYLMVPSAPLTAAPLTGLYTVLIEPGTFATPLSAALTVAATLTGTLTTSSPGNNVHIGASAYGQSGQYTFSGVTGGNYNLVLTSLPAGTAANVKVYEPIVNSPPALIGTFTWSSPGGSTVITAPTTATYTIVVAPASTGYVLSADLSVTKLP